MLLKDFITQLQEKYNNAVKDKEYYETMGEPEIYVDIFDEAKGGYRFIYSGYSPDIIIDLDPNNGNYVISAFGNRQESN
jgi:hypothetical protein